MDDKPIYLSTTMQGAVISFISLIVVLVKVNVSSGEITTFVTGAFGLIGLVMTVIGRLKANRNLTVGGKKL